MTYWPCGRGSRPITRPGRSPGSSPSPTARATRRRSRRSAPRPGRPSSPVCRHLEPRTAYTLVWHTARARWNVDVRWETVFGNRLSPSGWETVLRPLARTVARDDGTFVLRVRTPDDLGGTHRIVAGDAAGDPATTYRIVPSAAAVIPSVVAPGAPIAIRLQGVGWTETANTYVLDVDNALFGYGCGFNSQGDVTMLLRAPGRAGWLHRPLSDDLQRPHHRPRLTRGRDGQRLLPSPDAEPRRPPRRAASGISPRVPRAFLALRPQRARRRPEGSRPGRSSPPGRRDTRSPRRSLRVPRDARPVPLRRARRGPHPSPPSPRCASAPG